MQVRVDDKENILFGLKVFFSAVVVYGAVVLVRTLSGSRNMSGVTTLTTFVIYAVVMWLFFMVQKVYLVAYMKGNGVPVTERQFPEVHAAYLAMAGELGLAKVPSLFVIQQGGLLNAFAVRFSGRNYVAIYSDVFALAAADPVAVRFVLAHELGHVKRHHMSKFFWTFPSSVVPFLSAAYSRSCELTCDNIGLACAGAGSERGLLVLAAGKDLYRGVDIGAYLDDAARNESPAVRLVGLCLGHPYLPRRLRNLRSLSGQIARGALPGPG